MRQCNRIDLGTGLPERERFCLGEADDFEQERVFCLGEADDYLQRVARRLGLGGIDPR